MKNNADMPLNLHPAITPASCLPRCGGEGSGLYGGAARGSGPALCGIRVSPWHSQWSGENDRSPLGAVNNRYALILTEGQRGERSGRGLGG